MPLLVIWRQTVTLYSPIVSLVKEHNLSDADSKYWPLFVLTVLFSLVHVYDTVAFKSVPVNRVVPADRMSPSSCPHNVFCVCVVILNWGYSSTLTIIVSLAATGKIYVFWEFRETENI